MLSINTNLSSLIVQNSMKQSTNRLNTAIERLTTGFKINHAKDNAANYNIATNMTTQIGSLDVAEDNAMTSLDLLTTASDNLSLIQERVQRLRDLQEQACNGTYGEQALLAINAECNSLVDEINRLYLTTEYNGINLFLETTTNADGDAEILQEVYADSGTTFEELGITSSSFSVYDKNNNVLATYDIEGENTLDDFFATLEIHNFNPTIISGKISVKSTDNSYIAGALADELGITTELESYVASTSQTSSAPVTYNSVSTSTTITESFITATVESSLIEVNYNTYTTLQTTTETIYVTTTSQSTQTVVVNTVGVDFTIAQAQTYISKSYITTYTTHTENIWTYDENFSFPVEIAGFQIATHGAYIYFPLINCTKVSDLYELVSSSVSGIEVVTNEGNIDDPSDDQLYFEYNGNKVEFLHLNGTTIESAFVTICGNSSETLLTQKEVTVTTANVETILTTKTVTHTTTIEDTLFGNVNPAMIPNLVIKLCSYTTNSDGEQEYVTIRGCSTSADILNKLEEYGYEIEKTSNSLVFKPRGNYYICGYAPMQLFQIQGFPGVLYKSESRTIEITTTETSVTSTISTQTSVVTILQCVTGTVVNTQTVTIKDSKLSTIYTTTTETATVDTSFADMGMKSGVNIGVVINGNRTNINLNKDSSISDLISTLQANGLNASYSANKLTIEGTGDSYVSSSSLTNLFKLGTINKTSAERNINTKSDAQIYTKNLLDELGPIYAPGRLTLQVGVNADSNSQVGVTTAFSLVGYNDFRGIGIDGNNYLAQLDDTLEILNNRQVELGAMQNRLISALDEITVQRENLISSRSTLRDADIADISSEYIRQQILQQASATLLSTANQSASIALSLI